MKSALQINGLAGITFVELCGEAGGDRDGGSGGPPCKSRSACRLIAESFTAKLAGLNSGQGHLRLQHMQLQIGPTVAADRNERELESYLTQLHCYDQEPDEVTPKAAIRAELNNVSGTIQGEFPNGATVSATYQGGTSETYPSNIYGYDRTWIRAG